MASMPSAGASTRHCANSRFVFYEENQAVVVWGIPATAGQTEDPPVEQGVNGETIDWYREFLASPQARFGT